MSRCLYSLLVLVLASISSDAGEQVFFGTYTRGDSKGIYTATFSPEKGSLESLKLAVEVKNPSFLTIRPGGRFLYAVSELGESEGGGAVTAYLISKGGSLAEIGKQPSGGSGPCHLSMTSDGKILAVANYQSGSVASYRVEEDGTLSAPVSIIQHEGSSVNPKRQRGPHAHSVNFSPDDRFLYAADLGTDSIFVYSVDSETGALTAVSETKLPPGSGPRHFTFRPDGAFAYVIDELAVNVTAFSADRETGALNAIQSISTLPPDTEKTGSTAEVRCHPSGKFLYGSNRGHDTIVVYSIDGESGKLTYVENEPVQGEVPRNFVLSPDGEWLLAAGQKSNTVAVFAMDPETGELDYSGNSVEVPSPVCIRFR